MFNSSIRPTLLALALASCAQGAVPRARAVDPAQAVALEAVAHRGAASAEADGVRFSRTDGGAVRGVPVAPRPPDPPVDDVTVEAGLRGRVAADPAIAGAALDIDVNHGVVRLCGTVPDAAAAARLVDLALGTPGVRAVESSLAWVSPTELERLRRSSAPRGGSASDEGGPAAETRGRALR